MPNPVLYEENSMPFEVTIECGVPVDSVRRPYPLTSGEPVATGFKKAQLFFADAALQFMLDPLICPDIPQALQPFSRKLKAQMDPKDAPGYGQSPACTEQPTPAPNHHPAVWDLVMKDMEARDQLGESRYGTRLQPHNGRDALKDAYQEVLDLAVYLRQELYQRDGC